MDRNLYNGPEHGFTRCWKTSRREESVCKKLKRKTCQKEERMVMITTNLNNHIILFTFTPE
jgi:hypothetical protein